MLTLPPDFTFVIQLVSFLILWMGMKRLLFDPMIQVLEQREARTAGARQTAAELRAAAEGSAADYDRRLQEVRVKVGAEAQSSRATIEAEERKRIGEARDQAAAQLAQLRESLARQTEEARAGIAAEAQTMAAQMVERVVGRRLA
ncbi:MAG TPA: ATP synthase F0 subunit B [Candidatus Acidoferrales bacterium]|nr:ATP synthase F0 subunit B [Candidatus Acidoferrales bacterium]